MSNLLRVRETEVRSPKDIASVLNRFLEVLKEQSPRPRQVKEIALATTATVADAFPLPVALASDKPDRPLEVRVANIENVDDADDVPTDAVQVFWRTTTGHQIALTHITGLAASKKYRITLVIEWEG